MATAEGSFSSVDAAILSRMIHPERTNLTKEAAEALLQLTLDRVDLDRLHELVTRNQDDDLTAEDRVELESYLRISAFVDLMHAKARRSLRTKGQR